MTVDDIMKRHYSFFAAADLEDGGWVIKYPDLPGCMTTADTYEEIAINARNALEAWMKLSIEAGDTIPEPSDYPLPEWNWPDRGTDNEVLTVRQAADFFGISTRRIRAIASKRNVGMRIGQNIVFRRTDLEKLRPAAPGRPRVTV